MAIWIVVPAPRYELLLLSVGAPEISPILLVASLLVAIRAFRLRPHANRLAGISCLVAAALSAIPLIALQSTLRKFDADTAALPAAAPAPPVDQVSITRGIVFVEPGGERLTLDVYRPVLDSPLPIVIQIYGGAWQNGSPSDNSRFASTLAGDGYLVIAIDYRHAPQSRWPAQINDVGAAITWVMTNAKGYGGDTQRMALVGRSSGAQLALIAAYTHSDQFAAVVSFYGPTNLEDGWRIPPSPDPLPVRPVLEAFLGGTPDDVLPLYEAASPVTYVAPRVPPTLLVYGARDHIVDARFGRELHARLKAAGASSILLEVPWAEHSFDLIPGLSYRVTLPYVERFLAAHLK